jgi:hypothetical protein
MSSQGPGCGEHLPVRVLSGPAAGSADASQLIREVARPVTPTEPAAGVVSESIADDHTRSV